MRWASASVFPRISSVSSEPQAIAVTQPRVLKRASVMRSSEKRTANCMMSPQTGLLTSTVALAPGSSPALRGFLKWSSTAALYMPAVSQGFRSSATTGRQARRSRSLHHENLCGPAHRFRGDLRVCELRVFSNEMGIFSSTTFANAWLNGGQPTGVTLFETAVRISTVASPASSIRTSFPASFNAAAQTKGKLARVGFSEPTSPTSKNFCPPSASGGAAAKLIALPAMAPAQRWLAFRINERRLLPALDGMDGSPFREISAPVGGPFALRRKSIATGPAPHRRGPSIKGRRHSGPAKCWRKDMPGGIAMSSGPPRSLPRLVLSDAYEKHRKQAPLRRPFRYNPLFAEAARW